MAKTVNERADVVPRLGETFRELGYDGASLSAISQRTGLGKGSLYHFFPGGKADMAEAVLADISAWFDSNVFRPLADAGDAVAGIRATLRAVDAYFQSGRRICLVGAFALSETRDRFGDQVRPFFDRWRDALADALRRTGLDGDTATARAEDALIRIQGALVLARAQDDPAVFSRATARLETDLLAPAGTAA